MPGQRRHLTIKRPGVLETEVRKSRFVCSLARAADEDEAQEFIASVRREYWDARHNCTAFVVGDDVRRERSSDDGEPAGTAGAPMLEVLRRRGLTGTVAVVTRYFGGVLLGTGGLVRAYGGAVARTVDAVGTVERRPVELLAVTADHSRAGRLENDLRAAGHTVREVTYGPGGVRIEVGVGGGEAAAFRTWLARVTGGVCEAASVGRAFVEVDAD